MPKLGQIMVEGIVNKWHKSTGDAVAEGELIAEIETEKLNYDLEATGNGIFHAVASEGAVVAVDGVMAYLLADGESPPAAEEPSPAAAPVPAAPAARAGAKPPRRDARPPAGGQVPSSPGARRLAAKLGVDLSQVTATGPRGRVIEEDVRRATDEAGPSPAAVQGPSLAGLPEPSQTVPLQGMRKRIAEHMKGSLVSTAQLSFALELDVTEAQRLRKLTSSEGEVNLTTADVFMKACAQVIRRHPEHNTVLSGDSVLYFDQVNIGLAVSLSDGLIVPVLREVDQKSIAEIAAAARELVEKARDGKLSPDDMAGGTFTLSVVGSVDAFTPILNAGQTAILGVGRSVEKPVVKEGEVVVREMMTVSLTVDHQVVDGAKAAGFLRRLQQAVERPAALFK